MHIRGVRPPPKPKLRTWRIVFATERIPQTYETDKFACGFPSMSNVSRTIHRCLCYGGAEALVDTTRGERCIGRGIAKTRASVLQPGFLGSPGLPGKSVDLRKPCELRGIRKSPVSIVSPGDPKEPGWPRARISQTPVSNTEHKTFLLEGVCLEIAEHRPSQPERLRVGHSLARDGSGRHKPSRQSPVKTNPKRLILCSEGRR